MEKSRLEQFQEFVEMDPEDTFSRYALAMEYLGISKFEEAITHLDQVLKKDPGYSAAYFQAAIASEKLSRIDQAKDFLQRGIVVADKNGDRHARDEMKTFLEEIQSRSE